MGISGNLKTMALPELLQWLSMGGKTGTLVIEKEAIEKRIFFQEGAILSSASNDPKEYLGSFLSSHNYLSREVVDQALARQKTEKRLLGQILVDMAAISKEDVHQMLRLKTEETIYDIFTWEQGDFEFLDDELPDESMIRMALDVQGLVLEGSRRLDEWNRIREWVPSPKCVPVSIVDLQALELEEMDLQILEWVDDDRTVEDISRGAQAGLFDVASVIAAQVKEGTVKVVRPRTVEVKAEVEVPVAMQEPTAAPADFPAAPVQVPMQSPAGLDQSPPVRDPVALGSGRRLHFATDATASGTFPAQVPPATSAPAEATPAEAPETSEAETLIKSAEDSLAQGELEAALASYRKARDAPGGGQIIESAAKSGERKVQQALEREGIRLTTVPKLNCGMDELTQLSISPQEGFMLTRVDGSYDVKSILKMSPMPAIDAQILFWRLKKLGHVAV